MAFNISGVNRLIEYDANVFDSFSVPCNYREKCSFGDWGSWEGDIEAETPGCYKQMRTKPFKYPLQTQMRRFSCGGLNIECKLPPVQTSELCKLPVFANVSQTSLSLSALVTSRIKIAVLIILKQIGGKLSNKFLQNFCFALYLPL